MALLDHPCMEPYKQRGVPDLIGFYGNGATIRIGRASCCLRYMGFLIFGDENYQHLFSLVKL